MIRFAAGITIASICGILAQVTGIPMWLEGGAYVTLMGACIYAVIELYRTNKGLTARLVDDEKGRVAKLAEEMKARDIKIDKMEETITALLIEKANGNNKGL